MADSVVFLVQIYDIALVDALKDLFNVPTFSIHLSVTLGFPVIRPRRDFWIGDERHYASR